MKNYKDLFLSKDQYLIDSSTDFKRKIPEIISLINKYSDITSDWSKIEKTSQLTEKNLDKIQKVVSNEAQKDLVSIFSPYIEPHLKKLFGNNLKYKIRVSAQVKSCWTDKVSNEKRKGFFVDKVFFEDKKKPNIAFPTRAHQDLDNNGNRGSHTMIFYFQLTQALQNSSALEFGIFNDQIGILPFSSLWGYPNEITENAQKKISWATPDLTPGNIMLMTGLTPHRSNKIGQVPRVALNVKIQPSNLSYLNKIYGVSLSNISSGSNFSEKLNILKNIIVPLSKKHRLLLYELSVIYFLLGDVQNAKQTLGDLCLFNIDNKILEKWVYASTLKKRMYQVTEDEISKEFKFLKNIVPFSSGDAILETIKLNS